MRQLAAFEARRAELEELGATIIAPSVDSFDQATEVANRGFHFKIAYGATKADGDLLGAWWEDNRGYIQPTDFIIGRGGTVLGSMYGSGQVGRMSADEVFNFITSRENRRRQEEEANAAQTPPA